MTRKQALSYVRWEMQAALNAAYWDLSERNEEELSDEELATFVQMLKNDDIAFIVDIIEKRLTNV